MGVLKVWTGSTWVEISGTATSDHGSLGGLDDHDHAAIYFSEAEHLASSAGAADAGKPIKLDAAGHVDATMVNDGDIDHGTIGGLADDDHGQYRLESEDHTHQSAGAQAGQLDHGLALTGLTDDDHTQYLKESVLTTKGDIFVATGASTPARLGVGPNAQVLTADSGEASGIKWSAVGGGNGAPPGAILAYGGASAPGGYLMCDGAAANRTTYAALFGVIGTAYGVGDGSTTFNLPNLKQRFPLGKADSGTGDTLGDTGGAIDHTHTYDTVIAHLHSVDPPNRTSTGESSHIHSINPPNRTSTGESSHTHFSGIVEPGAGSYTTKQTVCGLAGSNITTSAGSSHTHDVNIPAFNSGAGGNHTHDVNIPSFNSGSTGSAEGTTASENPPFQVVNYIIKT